MCKYLDFQLQCIQLKNPSPCQVHLLVQLCVLLCLSIFNTIVLHPIFLSLMKIMFRALLFCTLCQILKIVLHCILWYNLLEILKISLMQEQYKHSRYRNSSSFRWNGLPQYFEIMEMGEFKILFYIYKIYNNKCQKLFYLVSLKHTVVTRRVYINREHVTVYRHYIPYNNIRRNIM